MGLLGASPNRAQDVQGDIYVEASVDNTTPFVGQQIIYTLRLYDAVGTTNPLYQPSDFDGFWRIDIGAVSQTTEQINGLTYTVTSIATALYPNQAGEISIQPASVVLPETVFRSRTTLSASPVLINVQPLPAGQPADFSGGVGSFELGATLDRQTASAGEPFTMQLTLSGTGNVEQLPPPTMPSGWRSTITPGQYTSQVRNGFVVGMRTYTILFYPQTLGKQILPTLSFSYFDLVERIYRSASTPSVEIEVTGTDLTSETAVQESIPDHLQLKPVQLFSESSLSLGLGFFAVVLVLPLVVVGSVLGWRWSDRNRRRQAALHKQKYALPNALQQIDQLKVLDVRSTYEQIDQILQLYVSNKLDATGIVKGKKDILSLMVANDVSDAALTTMMDLQVKVDEGLFAQPTHKISASEIQVMKDLLNSIDQQWERK